MTSPSFNATVSPSPVQKEIEAVLSLVVPHPFLLDAHKKVRQALKLPEGYGVLLVVGPPGVGKSALASACRMADLSHPKRWIRSIRVVLQVPSRWCRSRPAPGPHSFPDGRLCFWTFSRSRTSFGRGQGRRSSSSAPVPSGRGFETFSIPRLESAVIESLRYRRRWGLGG